MKDKINRLAKGIMEEDRPVILIRPESVQGVLEPGIDAGQMLEIESLSGKSMRGFCFCDDPRVRFVSETFMGRMAHQGFTVNTDCLPDGAVLEGVISLLTNAGEFAVPYSFTVKSKEQSLFGKNGPRAETARPGSPAGRNAQKQPVRNPAGTESIFVSDREEKCLEAVVPEDPELLEEACAVLIRENAAGRLAFALFQKALSSGLQLTHLYESFLSAWPEDRDEAMPRELLLYFSYETGLALSDADKLYSNVIRYEPESSELYRQYESRIRSFALKSLMDSRMNRNLRYIYDRMLYPDMIDVQMAGILPDILKSHRIRTAQPSAVTVHVRYPQLRSLFSGRLRNGQVCVPVYFSDALITFHDADGSEVDGGDFEDEELMERPDLLRRCFSVNSEHPMLLFSALREILGRGAAGEEEKKILIMALSELELQDSCRGEVIRELCRAGGDMSWIDQIPVSELDQETGNFAFRAFLESGRYKDAYLYLRSTGLENRDAAELAELADRLLSLEQKPVLPDGETDRFFRCVCKRVFDAGQASAQIMDFLTAEYEGASEEMFAVLSEADRNGLPVHGLPERLLSVQLFEENRSHMDETFGIYLKQSLQKENLLKACFTVRMTDYAEREDPNIAPEIFEALTAYLGIVRSREGLPEVYFIGLTKYFSFRETLSPKELELCQELTDSLISKELIFPYTKALRKKINIPASVCEKFFVEYIGTRTSVPRMTARILPDEARQMPVNLKRVFHNIFVASTVLFLGDEMHYRIWDEAVGTEPVQQGVIRVRKMHGKEEDRFLLLNRMTKAVITQDAAGLQENMLSYAVETEVNRGLFEVR